MVMKMRYLKEKVSFQYEVNKSIFIAVIYPVNDVNDLNKSLEDAKVSYPKATHYCSASLLGDHQEQQTADDDGEPSRTAGIPILDVLKHHDVTNILCVVIRYFGGIKLGGGGLIRAYTKAAAEVMRKASFYEKKYVPTFKITFHYKDIDTIDHFLNEKAIVTSKTFTETITYTFYLKPDILSIAEISYLLINQENLEPELLFIEA